MQSASEMRRENRLLMVFALTVALSKGATSIQCYKCTVTSSNYVNETKRLCSQFDYSEKYVIDCPYSTMCMKTDIRLDIQDGAVHAVERGCAAQKHDYLDYVNGRWERKVEVEEFYSEGCRQADDKGARSSPPTYCYCRGSLCNAAPSTNNESFHTDAMAVIIVFNLLKYIRSLR